LGGCATNSGVLETQFFADIFTNMSSIINEELDNENNSQDTSAITKEFINTPQTDEIDFSNKTAEDLYAIFCDTKLNGGHIGNFVLRGLGKVNFC
jgi:hypothetical protein